MSDYENGEENVKKQDDTNIQLVCFQLAEEEYGIDIRDVSEVIRVPQITPVPQMPNFVLGVVNIRGKVIPVFDLRKKFGLPERQFDNLTKIIVCLVGGVQVSIVIDNILDNITVDLNKIDPAPSVRMKIDRNCIRGLAILDARMVVVIDLQKVHDEIYRAIVAQRG